MKKILAIFLFLLSSASWSSYETLNDPLSNDSDNTDEESFDEIELVPKTPEQNIEEFHKSLTLVNEQIINYATMLNGLLGRPLCRIVKQGLKTDLSCWVNARQQDLASMVEILDSQFLTMKAKYRELYEFNNRMKNKWDKFENERESSHNPLSVHDSLSNFLERRDSFAESFHSEVLSELGKASEYLNKCVHTKGDRCIICEGRTFCFIFQDCSHLATEYEGTRSGSRCPECLQISKKKKIKIWAACTECKTSLPNTFCDRCLDCQTCEKCSVDHSCSKKLCRIFGSQQKKCERPKAY